MRPFLFVLILVGGASVTEPPEARWISGALDRLAVALPVRASQPLGTPSYVTAHIDRGDLVTTVEAAGTLNALVVVDVGSQVSGLVTELYADFNSNVTKGQVIARVDPETYEARVTQAEAELEMASTQIAVERAQLARARAELQTAESHHASAEAQLLRAEVAVTDALQELERKRTLAQRSIIAAGELERAENVFRSAEAQEAAARAQMMSEAASIRAAEAAVATAEAHLAHAFAQKKQREALLRQAQIDFERTFIRAPVTGTVVNRAVSGGQTLAASLHSPVLFTIAQDLTRMQVEASVVEADISRFAVGQPVTFMVDAYPGSEFSGAVRQIRQAPQIVQNVVTYVVVIDAFNPDGALMPGMTATLQVTVSERRDVLRVPNAALRFSPADTDPGYQPAEPAFAGAEGRPGRVYVLTSSGMPSPVALRLGITDGLSTEVIAGTLDEGEEVVLSTSQRREEPGGNFRFRLQ